MLPDLFEVGAMTPGTPAEEHKLFSVTHPDVDETDIPADKDVLTFFEALGKWKGAPAAGGVTDHGLLDGLLDDDHSQYALLAGRARGQTLKGGTGAVQHLTLQSTVQFPRGYVRAQDDLQLLSNILRDSGGNNRVQLAAASPHLLFTGNQQLSGVLGLMGSVPDAAVGLKLTPTVAGSFTGIECDAAAVAAANTAIVYGLEGIVSTRGNDGTIGHIVKGLNFEARAITMAESATFADLIAARVQVGYVAITSGVQTITKSRGLFVDTGFGMGTGTATISVPDHRQIDVSRFTLDFADDVYGIRVADQVFGLVRNYIGWFGNEVPQMYIEGGAYSVAGKTAMVLNVAGTLYRVIRNAVSGALETEAA